MSCDQINYCGRYLHANPKTATDKLARKMIYDFVIDKLKRGDKITPTIKLTPLIFEAVILAASTSHLSPRMLPLNTGTLNGGE